MPRTWLASRCPRIKRQRCSRRCCTLSYVAVSGTIAYVVYQYFGLRFLRRAWINMNVIWAVALIVTAVATPLV